jgi:hypothetical protein
MTVFSSCDIRTDIKPGRRSFDPRQSRLERFCQDQERLNKLPCTPFDYRSPESLWVNREGVFTYETNQYSIPAEYIGKQLLGLRDPMKKTMAVYDGQGFIREYHLYPKSLRKKHIDPKDRDSLLKAWQKSRDGALRRAKQKIETKKLQAEYENTVQDPGIYDRMFNPDLEEVLS